MANSPELQFIFNVLTLTPSPIKLKISPSINWSLLYKLVIRHRIWHQLFAALTPLNHEMSIPIYERLKARCRQDSMRILAIAAETARIGQLFTTHHIQHCFLKGIVLNIHLYGALTTRPCKDIDVWVDPHTYEDAAKLLLSLGYLKILPAYDLNGVQKQYFMSHKHDIAFYHHERKMLVELHFRLHEFGVNFFPPTPAICQTVSLFNTQIMTLQDDYHLLYLMIHGAVHAWTRLRWLNDVVLYIKSGKCSLNHVMKLARDLECEHVVEQTLLLVQNNFGLNDPELSRLITDPSQRGKKIAHAAQAFIEADYELTPEYRVYNKMFFYYRFYLAKLAPPKHRLKVVLGDLFKIDYLFSYVRLPDKLFFLYYFLYPLWIIRVIVLR